MNIALMFSGQGSQYHGMGKDLYDYFDEVKNIFHQAETITKYPLREIIFNQNDDRLHETKYTQVSMFTIYQSVLMILKKYKLDSNYSFGLSLGEYGAYLHNEVFDFETGLDIIKHRAAFMEEASLKTPGKMCAVINLNPTTLESLVNESPYRVNIANYNTPQQLVISGEERGVDEISLQAKEKGAKRIIELKTSGAFHSSLMDEAANQFYDYLEHINLNEPTKHLYINLTGRHYINEIKEVMVNQINHSVKFYQMIDKLIEKGIDTFIEIGPKTTLCNFIKRINPQVKLLNIENIESLKNTLTELEVEHGIK